jgi:hypothetical protein
MDCKIITSRGEIFDIELQIADKLELSSVISGREFVEFVNNNYYDIVINDTIREVYNKLWANEEQFTSYVIKNMVF